MSIKGQVKVIKRDKQNRIISEELIGYTNTPTHYGWLTTYDTPINCDEYTSIQIYDPNSKTQTFQSELEELLDRYCFINETNIPNQVLAEHVFKYIRLYLETTDKLLKDNDILGETLGEY